MLVDKGLVVFRVHHHLFLLVLPSGKQPHNYGKSMKTMGFYIDSTIYQPFYSWMNSNYFDWAMASIARYYQRLSPMK